MDFLSIRLEIHPYLRHVRVLSLAIHIIHGRQSTNGILFSRNLMTLNKELLTLRGFNVLRVERTNSFPLIDLLGWKTTDLTSIFVHRAVVQEV